MTRMPDAVEIEVVAGSGVEGARRATGGPDPATTLPARAPDPEVPSTVQRRRFSAAYRLRILKAVDACKKPGEVGALLRREGLYSSLLTNWRRQREAGALREMRGHGDGLGPEVWPEMPHLGRLTLGVWQRESPDSHNPFILNALLLSISPRFPRRFPHCKRESTAPSEPSTDGTASQLAHRPPPFSASKSRRTSSCTMSADQPYAAATAASRASGASASHCGPAL